MAGSCRNYAFPERQLWCDSSIWRYLSERRLSPEGRLSSTYFEGLLLSSRRLYSNNVHLPHNNANAVGRG